MKLKLRWVILLIINICALSSFAAGPTKYFEELSVFPAFNYSYVSPTMLKMMGENYLSASSRNFDNLPIQCKDLSSIENISTLTNGGSEKLWKIIQQIKKEKHMETLTTKKSDNYRYDVLVTLTKDGKKITNLMVITQNGSNGNSVDVIYMEGKIPMESIQYSFY